jgi:hypothetical protein
VRQTIFPAMSAAYGLPLIGVLVILLVLARGAARKDRLRRRKREPERFYWESKSDRSERSQMREDSHQNTVMDTMNRRGSRSTGHKP